ncbi:MAG: hypothetical protein FGF51_04490, partial [Candidatus Brockarchaeota archaeon]|nr:hypothetical protein [Candidatus Brockarchaeota archaeon]
AFISSIGNYYVKIEPLTLDNIAEVLTNIKDLDGKPIVTYENGKLEFLGKWELKNFEYEPNKNELKSALAIPGTNKRITVDAHYDSQMGMAGKLAVYDGAYWRNVKASWVDDARKVITLKYGENSHLVLSYEGDSLMPETVGPPSAWGEVYYRITAEHLSSVLNNVEASFGGDEGRIDIELDYTESYHDLKRCLATNAQGVFGTQIAQGILKKSGIETIVDETGSNQKGYRFDLMNPSDDPNKPIPDRITFVGEVKTRYEEAELPMDEINAELSGAAEQLRDAARNMRNSDESWRLQTDYGYAIIVNITPNKVIIHWRKVSLEG